MKMQEELLAKHDMERKNEQGKYFCQQNEEGKWHKISSALYLSFGAFPYEDKPTPKSCYTQLLGRNILVVRDG